MGHGTSAGRTAPGVVMTQTQHQHH